MFTTPGEIITDILRGQLGERSGYDIEPLLMRSLLLRFQVAGSATPPGGEASLR